MKPKRLGRRAQRLLRGVDGGCTAVVIPAIVAVELSLLLDAGRDTIRHGNSRVGLVEAI
jgi:hypothetical protein